ISANVPGDAKVDTVGPPCVGVEVAIALDGEILVRGEMVMQGYWQDREATAAALRDGWLHTGDVGVVGADGHIRITDRKSDVIGRSGGDNVAPQKGEGTLLLQREIGQALVYGDRRPYLVALIAPHPEFCASFARAHQLASNGADLAAHPLLQA